MGAVSAAMRRRRTPPRVLVVMSLATIAFAALLLFVVVRYVSRNPDVANLGADVIRLDADRTAERIEETGPYPLQDPHGDRDVYLQHVGDDPQQGWVLVLARSPNEPCTVLWDVERDVFEAPCSDRTYPPDGDGLTTFPAPVENGRVVIDLRG